MYTTVLFLDLYGVLITPKSQMRTVGFSTFDKDAVQRLRTVVENNTISIVVSSTLRMTSDWKERLLKSFKVAGWEDPPITDRTPHVFGSRGEEIEEWLRKNKTKKYIILDDHTDVLPHQKDRLVLCNPSLGITDNTVKEIEEKLQ